MLTADHTQVSIDNSPVSHGLDLNTQKNGKQTPMSQKDQNQLQLEDKVEPFKRAIEDLKRGQVLQPAADQSSQRVAEALPVEEALQSAMKALPIAPTPQPNQDLAGLFEINQIQEQMQEPAVMQLLQRATEVSMVQELRSVINILPIEPAPQPTRDLVGFFDFNLTEEQMQDGLEFTPAINALSYFQESSNRLRPFDSVNYDHYSTVYSDQTSGLSGSSSESEDSFDDLDQVTSHLERVLSLVSSVKQRQE